MSFIRHTAYILAWNAKDAGNDPYVDFTVFDYMECPQHKATER